jgi:predicted nuclease of predicted toxin-antitoxin system
MRFLTDIPIGRATVLHLIEQGHDAVGVGACLSPQASDAEIIRHAAAEERVIICFALDFAALVALSGERLPSVITFRTSKHQAQFINRRLDTVLPDIAADLSRGALATVEDQRVRLRSLPLRSEAPG